MAPRRPLTRYFELVKLLDTSPQCGDRYGDDSLDIPDEDWPVVESLLIELRLLYRIHQVHTQWQNAQTDSVRRRFMHPQLN